MATRIASRSAAAASILRLKPRPHDGGWGCSVRVHNDLNGEKARLVLS
jgi:hypothetical protein